MDEDAERLSQSNAPAVCALCQRILSPDNEASGDLETISICGDCKFLFLEDLGSPAQESHRRRPHRGRRTRYSSSESIETLFSQQFSHMIDLVRQNQSTISGHEEQPEDSGTPGRILQRTSSRTTPSGSRRWRRVLSDTESDGFDNLDSIYGETESNVSYGRYRVSQNESDVISFSAYGGDSDASVDGLDTEAFIHRDDGSNFDSDTDIDPMHAGLDQWNSDDVEEEEEDGEWEEDDAEEDTTTSTVAHTQNFGISNPTESDGLANWRRNFYSPAFNGTLRWRVREGRHTYIHDTFANSESELLPNIGNSGDYLDARGFEELLEHLAENDSSRRGAPPAAMSFVNSLPRVVINQEHLKHESLACAICKDLLQIGSEVNQLPCFHFYHPSCILPWLSSRNSCPLCRYELPTDDKDYEEQKRNTGNRIRIHAIQQENESEDSSSDVSDRVEVDAGPAAYSSRGEGGRGRWFYFAAPIVSLVGIALVLWLGNPLIERRGRTDHCNLSQQIHGSVSPSNQRENRNRRWWSLF